MDKPPESRLCLHQMQPHHHALVQQQASMAPNQLPHPCVPNANASNVGVRNNQLVQQSVQSTPPHPFTATIALQAVDITNAAITSAAQTVDQRLIQQFDPNSMTVDNNVPQILPYQGLGDFGANISNIINEKVAIYRHPLFPLLRILFEKCEVATNSIETVNSITFDHEIKSFITQMAKENKPFFTDDAEVDGLMLKSLQVLRIHLLELEKVNELCKDFCTRYISCLKGKLNSENIMKTLDISNTPPESPNSSTIKMRPNLFEETLAAVGSKLPENSTQTELPMNAQISVNHNEIQSRGASTSLLPDTDDTVHTSFGSHPHSISTDGAMSMPGSESSLLLSDMTSGFLSKKSKCGKRGVLPKAATNVLKAWLFQHLVHPYPSEEEKKQLALQTNLSNLQVNNWFINARRRILQPMLDTSNSVLKNNKKSKQQRNAARKDWTNSIGVYNAYRTEALQTHAATTQTQQPLGFVIDSRTQSAAMLVNLPDGHTQPVVLTQPLQFVQVSQVPIQTMAGGFLPLVQTAITQSPSLTTVQQPVVVPSINEQKPTSDLSSTAIT